MKVFFRVDGNSEIGLGHAIRCLALAEMLRSNFSINFILRNNSTEELVHQIEKLDFVFSLLPILENYEAEAKFITDNYELDDSIIVLDGYYFNTSYQKILRSTGVKIVAIDDIHSYHFVADVIINHAGGISSDSYSANQNTQFFLGPKYALLRNPFLQLPLSSAETFLKKDNLFISLGGADPNNVVIEVLKKLQELTFTGDINLVLGVAYIHKEQLDNFINRHQLNLTIYQNLSAQEMADLMSKCGMAITSASTVSYEYLCTKGLLFIIKTADNQNGIFKFLIEQKLGFSFDRFLRIRNREINDSLKKRNKIFDGLTSIRLNQVFKSLC